MQGVEVVSWDVGGRCNIRPLYRHYYPDMRGIIYVVDSSSRDEIVWSKEELSRLLAEELLLGLPLLIVANKMDVPTALTLEDVAEGLDLSIIISKSSPRKYQVIGCSTNGLDGIKGGLSWLRAQIRSAAYSSPNTLKKETSVFTKYDSDNDNMTEIVGDSSSALDENDTTAEHLESNHPPLDTESLDDEISGRNTILTTS